MNDEAPEITPEQYQKLMVEAAANNWQCTVCGYNDIPLVPPHKGGFACVLCARLLAMTREHFEEYEKEWADNETWQSDRHIVKIYDPDLDWYRYALTGEEVEWEHPDAPGNRKGLGEYLVQESIRVSQDEAEKDEDE